MMLHSVYAVYFQKSLNCQIGQILLYLLHELSTKIADRRTEF